MGERELISLFFPFARAQIVTIEQRNCNHFVIDFWVLSAIIIIKDGVPIGRTSKPIIALQRVRGSDPQNKKQEDKTMTLQERTAILFQVLGLGEQAFDLLAETLQDERDFPLTFSVQVAVDGESRELSMTLQIF